VADQSNGNNLMASIRYCVISVRVDELRQMVKVQYKLPSHVARCTGFIVKHLSGVEHNTDLPQIGNMSIEFNNRKEHPVNAVVDYAVTNDAKMDCQELDVDIQPNNLVNIFYADLFPYNLEFTPYKVNVYLRCSTALISCHA
jgi:hypothetical protein